MARGPKKHLKLLNAPKSWMLHKMAGIWAPRPSCGPHKLRESLPMTIILRNRLKYALTRREVTMIVMRRCVKVDNKVRTDNTYPCGFQDVVQIDKTNERFRILYDVKGRFILHPIDAEEAKFKLCRVYKVAKGKKASIGRNPLLHGQQASIPYVVTHDGRTIRYPDPAIKLGDTIKLDLTTGKIVGHIKFDVGNLAMATRGANSGRVGFIYHREKHPGSHDIVHLKDKKGHTFATRGEYVFIIGHGKKEEISLPRKHKGVATSILEEQKARKN